MPTGAQGNAIDITSSYRKNKNHCGTILHLPSNATTKKRPSSQLFPWGSTSCLPDQNHLDQLEEIEYIFFDKMTGQQKYEFKNCLTPSQLNTVELHEAMIRDAAAPNGTGKASLTLWCNKSFDNAERTAVMQCWDILPSGVPQVWSKNRAKRGNRLVLYYCILQSFLLGCLAKGRRKQEKGFKQFPWIRIARAQSRLPNGWTAMKCPVLFVPLWAKEHRVENWAGHRQARPSITGKAGRYA